MIDEDQLGPIVIGGVGGSGTRVVAALVQHLGVFIGDHLNESLDNLDFPGLHRYLKITGEAIEPWVTDREVAMFAAHMTSGAEAASAPRWGWKNPPNFLFLESFATYFPAMRYVHVIRHGLDMAYSGNTRQARQWGHLFGVEFGVPDVPRSLLAYWIRANEHALDVANRLLGIRCLVLDFDQLCRDARPHIASLAAFLDVAIDDHRLDSLAASVRPPHSTGRFRLQARPVTDRFSAVEIEAVRRLGFEV